MLPRPCPLVAITLAACSSAAPIQEERAPIFEVEIPPPPPASSPREGEPEPPRARHFTRTRGLAGEWTEHWPGRGGCDDIFVLAVDGGQIVIESSDCNDQEPYRIEATRFDGQVLRFELHVDKTGSVLEYVLELVERGAMQGNVRGGAEAEITWTKNQPF